MRTSRPVRSSADCSELRATLADGEKMLMDIRGFL